MSDLPLSTGPSRARTALATTAWIVGFPVVWPLFVLRNWARSRAHSARVARIEPARRDEIVARIERGEATGALTSVHLASTIASGLEEEHVFEVAFGASSEVVAYGAALERALATSSPWWCSRGEPGGCGPADPDRYACSRGR